MHYCIGDIHGCYDEMRSLIQKIERRDRHAQFMFLGDFPDRGPKVWETMNWMFEYIKPNGRYQSVVGNHDRLLMDWFFDWIEWYKKQPLKDKLLGRLDRSEEPKPDYDFYEVAKAHRALKPRVLNLFISAYAIMPYHRVLRIEGAGKEEVTFDIAHAWFSYEYPLNSYAQRMFNTWARETEGNHVNDHIIIHGHTPTTAESYRRDPLSPPGMIVYRKNAINLDGGCCYYEPGGEFPCMLCAICLETLEEFYSHTLEERLGEEKAEAFRKRYYSQENPYRAQMRKRLGAS